MKTVVRNVFTYSLALYFLPFIIPGVRIEGGVLTILMGGIGLAFMFLVLRPILSILSLPVNMLTLGLFSIVINAVIVYLLTVFISGIYIFAFTYPRSEILGFVTPRVSFNMFFAYIWVGFVLSCIDSFWNWMRD